MKIAVIGTGYVGLVAGACFADVGNSVTCVDKDPRKIDMLLAGEIPIYEPGLEDVVARNVADERLSFSLDTASAVRAADVIFIAVGTPPGEDGSADLSHVLAVAEAIGQSIDAPGKIIVCKSTVPVGTSDRVRDVIAELTEHDFHVAFNPEFLKEGSALSDFNSPDRVIVGCDDRQAAEVVGNLYKPFMRRSERLLYMDARSAEMTKYASNSMLATKISFINEIANLCDAVGADVELVRRGMAMDERIGPHFIYPGSGYGGSCLVGSESLLVRHAGRTRLTTFSRLFDQLAGGVDESPEPLALTPTDLEVLSWAPGDTSPRFRPVSHVTRRGYEGPLHTIKTKMGRRVRVTADHPFVTLSAGGESCVRLAHELTTSDWLPLARGRSLAAPTAHDLDLLAVMDAHFDPQRIIVRLGDVGREALESMDNTDVTNALNHERGQARVYDIKRTGAVRLDEARALALPLEGAMFGTARNGTYVPATIPCDARAMRILGLYLAEGHITTDGRRRRIFWSFHPENEEHLVDEVASFWRELGVTARVYTGTSTRIVSVSSRILAQAFLSWGLGGDCYSHTIPGFVWGRSAEERRSLLSGAWHGDGSWSLVNGGPSVVLEYGTVSRPLADGLIRLLADFGVNARLKVGRAAKSTTDTYWLIVSGADDVEALIDLVPEPEREDVLASIASQSKRIAPTGTRDLGHEGVVGARIVSNESKHWQGLVYSLEVPEAHTFVTSFGLVTHNCFPKDVRALARLGEQAGVEVRMLHAVEGVNNLQKLRLVDLATGFYQNDLAGKHFAVWGLSFKPKTDDIREAPALLAVRELVARGATVTATDPVALENARADLADLGDAVTFHEDDYATLEGADALFIFTEWNEFRSPDFDRIAVALSAPVIFDGRNIYDPDELRARGFTYFCVGRNVHNRAHG